MAFKEVAVAQQHWAENDYNKKPRSADDGDEVVPRGFSAIIMPRPRPRSKGGISVAFVRPSVRPWRT